MRSRTTTVNPAVAARALLPLALFKHKLPAPVHRHPPQNSFVRMLLEKHVENGLP